MATRAQQQAVTGTLDIASGLLQATPSVLSLVIYLMNVLLPRLQQAFANRPLLRKVLSVALPGGLAASLVFKVLNRLWDSFIWKKFLYWTTSVGYVESGDILNWAIWHQMHTTKKVMNHNTYTFCSRSFFRNRFTSDDVDAEHVHCGKSTDLTRVPFDQHYVFWHGGRLFCTTFDKEKYRREVSPQCLWRIDKCFSEPQSTLPYSLVTDNQADPMFGLVHRAPSGISRQGILGLQDG